MIRFIPVLHVVSLLLLIISFFMLAPLGIAIYNDNMASTRAFGITIVCTVVFCSLLWWLTRSKNGLRHQLRTREGFLMVTASWIAVSAVGAIPFVLSGAITSYTDAFFETISGFTTTGASVLTAIETAPKSILFWRSLTHWLGGMGIVVLTVAILPFLGVGGVQLVRAESPGPTLDKIAPRITQTAKILWFLYLGFTVLETVLLMAGGMNLFDALTHTFGTLATGGFSTRDASVGAYNSGFIDWVIIAFMIIAGTNFALFYKLSRGNLRDIFRNTEFKTYVLVIISSVLIITLVLLKVYGDFGKSLRYAGFQAVSIITTTGFATADFDMWPMAAKGVLLLLMFVGGCSGSTGGGPKVIRVVTLVKLALKEMRYMSRPRGIFRVHINGEPIKKNFLYSVSGFFVLYLLCLLFVTVVVSIFGAGDITTAFSTALVTVGNIGPGFASIGPTMNYAFYPPFVKWVLSVAMLAGRLEVYTVLILLTPSFWRRA
ncbi:Trk potassium uptake system protein TrkH [Olavius algarvensis spirochete endosymbiont]|uniref:TrkH family potassium uptake protein n=1 Tax=Olavius algarvensis spirochete endosymbiont TaxID=260710 RepID=UPI000F25F89E|nr:potassium transporter TrkG [Olavius algarvensis spirochete endosymbiont]VDB00100.1 Trk potassium uptake system protein TrkH [Olavius algarvensis spirochete endosymbiont]